MILLTALALGACATQTPPQPQGAWFQLNAAKWKATTNDLTTEPQP